MFEGHYLTKRYLNQQRAPSLLSPATGETFYERCQAFVKKILFRLPPDASCEGRCWPGEIFHHRVYGRATSQK